ncbi:MAG: 3-phosphoshikimate 1-carboxyvinyltransferase [Desulfobacterales bacterium]|nr:3-phosphoshikimate 1-carboxyvinyltransferase [Desulfobacterales bacterium]
MKEIKTGELKDTSVTIPGSKSYSHRSLIAASLSNGISKVENCLQSEDTLLTIKALKTMGVDIEEDNNIFTIYGNSGIFPYKNSEIYLANSGTSLRLLTGIAAIGNGTYLLTGTDRMHERPISDLLDALSQLDVNAFSVNKNSCPPVSVKGARINGGKISVDCSISSQYLSALLLISPFSINGVEISLPSEPVSKPYIDMTIDIMERAGIKIEQDGYRKFFVEGNQVYKSGQYVVEPDCSNASYYWGAAAITGKKIKVNNISTSSVQGDVKFVKLLEEMGCDIKVETDGISVLGKPLKAINADMSDMPDVAPTLAVVAAFAEGETIINNVSHLKAKECDRLNCTVAELQKMGVKASCTDDKLFITGGGAKEAVIDTYDDHRMAMSFSLAGLVTPGIKINDEMCVAKSFPNYWDVFDQLYK